MAKYKNEILTQEVQQIVFTETVTFPAALAAGLLSFFSPCILPLIPAYFTFITGLSLDEMTEDSGTTRKKVILATLAYVAGFSTVFILLGASASLVGGWMAKYTWIIQYAGGAIVLVFGLHLLGVINIKGLSFEKRIHLNEKPLHILGTFVIGMAFGAGWSPCIGPMLGSILIVAGNQDTILKGIFLLATYSAGLALPFILISVFINRVLEIMKKMTRVVIYVNRVSGVLLIILGILLISDKFRMLTGL